MTKAEVSQRARELLAAELDVAGLGTRADRLRSGVTRSFALSSHIALAVVERALSQPVPATSPEVEAMVERLRELPDAIQEAAERLSCEAQTRSTGNRGEEDRLRAKMGSIAADLFGQSMMIGHEAADLLTRLSARRTWEDGPPYRFARYVNGERMAEGVRINQADSLDDAIRKAVRMCPESGTVLVPIRALKDSQ